MIKKILFIYIALLFVLCGCDSSITGKEAWDKFDKALEFTSSLRYYSLETIEVIDGAKVTGKLIYTTDDLGKTLAYKEVENAKSWWYDGLIYYEENGKKVKKALGIDDFLEITKSDIDWTYEMANNVKLDDGVVTFDVSLGYFETCTVEAKLGKVFLEELTVKVEIVESGTVYNKSLTYKYINPGKKPNVSLPEDIDEYCY